MYVLFYSHPYKSCKTNTKEKKTSSTWLRLEFYYKIVTEKPQTLLMCPLNISQFKCQQ